jgi:hypothetical protein
MTKTIAIFLLEQGKCLHHRSMSDGCFIYLTLDTIYDNEGGEMSYDEFNDAIKKVPDYGDGWTSLDIHGINRRLHKPKQFKFHEV